MSTAPNEVCDLRVLRDSPPFLSSNPGRKSVGGMFSSGCERGIPSDSVTIVTIAGRCLVSPIVRVRSRATHNPRKTERIGKAVTARRCRHHPHSPTTFCRFASPVDQTTLADRSSFTMTQPWTMLGSLRAGANQVRPHHALRPDHSGGTKPAAWTRAGGRSTSQASGDHRASKIRGHHFSGRTSRSGDAVDELSGSRTLNRPDGSSPPVDDRSTAAVRA